ncbi:MAG: MBOAT family protein [Clostridia bacterium]|nr:MBOAT family protein [Clostridia bacterium]
MLFSSLEFLLLFFPVTFGIHFLLPKKARNFWLLLASLFFYAWGEPEFVLIMIGSICINYALALAISRAEKPAGKRAILCADIVLNLAVLFVFKYLNFVTRTLHAILPATQGLFGETSIALPVGISFFTFQAISYVADVYRGYASAQRNLFSVGLYISLFPQLIAGPIVRYTTVMDQIRERTITVSSFSEGMLRFMAGFNKKILLANVLAEAADAAFAARGGSAGMAWFGALCYSLQIYFDFSGYSDMAIGLGRMLGFRFPENFDTPYISKSVTEFWRRWHISLGTWFRDYVYFPMGGSRVSSRRKLIRNLLTVWILTGIWHGANWTFLLWGLMYGVLILFEKRTDLPRKAETGSRLLRAGLRTMTLLTVMMGWILFRSDSIGAAWDYIRAMFGGNGTGILGGDVLLYAREYAVFWIAGILLSMPAGRWLLKKAGEGSRWEALLRGAGYAAQLILFAVSITMLVMNSHNPFIYFNF